MPKLDGKTTVITGGSRGIGFATARAFCREGAKVVIFGRDQGRLDAAVAELGSEAVVVRGDVTQATELDRLVQTVIDRGWSIDVLFVNAGIAKYVPFEQVDDALYDAVMDVNVKGAYFTIQKSLRAFSNEGSVILTTSAVEAKGLPRSSVYAASKCALHATIRRCLVRA